MASPMMKLMARASKRWDESLRFAEERFVGVKENAILGDIPIIDTVEAQIQLDNRRFDLIQAQTNFLNAGHILNTYLWSSELIPLELKEDTKPREFDVLLDLPDERHRTILDLANYFPILLFILVGIAVGIVPMFLGKVLAPSRPDAEKLSSYECGFEAFEDARMKFDVRYYLVAILFILFDLEIAFLFPWAVSIKDIGMLGFFAMMEFVGILVIGFVYMWKKGALDWE